VYRAARRCGYEPVLLESDDPAEPPRSYEVMMREAVLLWRRVKPHSGLLG